MEYNIGTGDEQIRWTRITVSGNDSAQFLQGQVTQDTGNLGSGKWTFILHPDSSILALAWMTSSEDSFSLQVPQDLAEATGIRLKRFVLRSKVSISMAEESDPVLPSLQAAFDVGYPVVVPSMQLTPLSFGDTWVREAISFTKGCYTGQELVGRLDARSAPVPFRVVTLVAEDLESLHEYLGNGAKADSQEFLWGFARANGIGASVLVHRTLLAEENLALHPKVKIASSSNSAN
jgi:folate-binding protein YgfZ